MSNKRSRSNRGQVLATAVESTGLNKEDVAKKAGYSRSAYYKHIESPNLNYSIMIAYGKAINHDFTDEFPDMPKYLLSEADEVYGNPKTLPDALTVLNHWRNKYLELLEKYNRLLEEGVQKKG